MIFPNMVIISNFHFVLFVVAKCYKNLMIRFDVVIMSKSLYDNIIVNGHNKVHKAIH